MTLVGDWLVILVFVALFFGPPLTSIVINRLRADQPRETHRQAAARYGRHGHEARRAALREADEVDAAWRDSLPDVVAEAITRPTTRPINRFR